MTRRRLRARGGAVALAAVAVLAAGCSSAGSTRHDDGPTGPATTGTSSAVVPVTPTVAPGTTTPASSPAPSSSAATSSTPSATPTATRAPSRTPAGAVPTGSGTPLVVLDPGHNGGNSSHVAQIDALVPAGYGKKKACNTTGTETDAGYAEHAFTWDVSKRVRAILQAHGVRVRMTRSSDAGVGPCVDERARLESAKGVTLSVAIHADGAPSSGHGFHVNEDSRRPVGASAATVTRTAALAEDLHAALSSTSGLVPSTYIGTDGYFYRTDLAGLNLTTTPTSFLELGNMRNAHDAALQSSASGRQRIAASVAAGILAYLKR